MKFFLFLFSVISISSIAYTQTVENIKENKQIYIWGEGKGNTLRKADNEALSMLINQISTEVESSFTLLKNENLTSDNSDYNETVNSVVKTYSNASLKNTERIVISNEPEAVVFRYIKRSDVEKIFESRKQKILGFTQNGNTAIENLQIGDALRYYNWALTLLRSHPDGNELKIKLKDNSEQTLATWLPFQIQQILSGIEAQIIEIENLPTYIHVILNFTWNGKPVNNYEYSYWDGKDWSNIISAKGGTGFVELPLNFGEINEIQLKSEYIFENEASIDNELKEVINKLDPIPFRNAYYKTKKAKTSYLNKNKPDKKINLNTKEQFYSDIIEKVCFAINTNNYSQISEYFTKEGNEIFSSLIKYGNARVLSKDNFNFTQINDKIICRSIKMKFDFENNTRSFVEDVIFTFENNKISDITFALENTATQNILQQDLWNKDIRLTLIDFLEHYKTAFALKKLEYINNIFSDDALIITGWTYKQQPTKEFPYQNNDIIKYNKYTKEEYLKKMQLAFQSNEFINIKFNDNNIRKSGKGGEVYGIQIQQDYFSSNYGDSGYLFLLIDLNNISQPLIHVRTWQPEKNPDGTIYGVEDF